MTSFRAWVAVVGVAVAISAAPAAAETQARPRQVRGCDELFRLPGIVWRGTTRKMTLQQLASYVAPVFWLSPDEPTLERKRGRDIRVPAAFPFEP